MTDENFEEPAPPSPHGFEHFIRENPTAVVVGALIAGILLGRLGLL